MKIIKITLMCMALSQSIVSCQEKEVLSPPEPKVELKQSNDFILETIPQTHPYVQSFFASPEYQQIDKNFSNKIDRSSVKLVRFGAEGESKLALFFKFKDQQHELVAYLNNKTRTLLFRILIKEQSVTQNGAGKYSGRVKILTETGGTVADFTLKANQVTNNYVSRPAAEESCFGDCREAAEKVIEDDLISYIACSINPCWIGIAAKCGWDCW